MGSGLGLNVFAGGMTPLCVPWLFLSVAVQPTGVPEAGTPLLSPGQGAGPPSQPEGEMNSQAL